MKTESEIAQERSNRSFFSSSYHRYFEGYSEYEVTDEKGVSRIRRIYTGMYYIPELDRKQWILHRLVQSMLWIAAWALLIFGASRQGAGNSIWYVGICQAVDVAVLVWIGSALFNYLIASAKMTVGEWRSSAQRIIRGSICALVSIVVTAVMTVLDLMLTGEGTVEHLCSTACYLLASLCMVTMWMTERRIVYKRVPSTERAPGFAAQIR